MARPPRSAGNGARTPSFLNKNRYPGWSGRPDSLRPSHMPFRIDSWPGVTRSGSHGGGVPPPCLYPGWSGRPDSLRPSHMPLRIDSWPGVTRWGSHRGGLPPPCLYPEWSRGPDSLRPSHMPVRIDSWPGVTRWGFHGGGLPPPCLLVPVDAQGHQQGWAEQDQPQGRKDAADGGEQDLQRRARCLRADLKAAFDAHLR